MNDLPSLSDLRVALFDALRFEGNQGLWEAVWRLNASHPSVALDAKVALARELILGLLDERKIELSVAEWPASDGRAVTAEELNRLRVDDTPWFDPERAQDLLVWIGEPGHG